MKDLSASTIFLVILLIYGSTKITDYLHFWEAKKQSQLRGHYGSYKHKGVVHNKPSFKGFIIGVIVYVSVFYIWA